MKRHAFMISFMDIRAPEYYSITSKSNWQLHYFSQQEYLDSTTLTVTSYSSSNSDLRSNSITDAVEETAATAAAATLRTAAVAAVRPQH
jgi:hypothetical protein